MKKTIVFLLAFALSMVFTQTSFSASITGSLNLELTVSGLSACQVESPWANLGAQDISSTGATTTADIRVACAGSTSYTIALDSGLNGDSTMSDATDTYSLSYTLEDSGTAWGDFCGANTNGNACVSDTGNDLWQSHVVTVTTGTDATIPAATVLSDTVTITVTW